MSLGLGMAGTTPLWGQNPPAAPDTAAQEPKDSVRVIGRVLEYPSGQPLADAVVRFGEKGDRGDRGLERVTDPAGRFVFDEVPVGDQFVEVEHLGHERAADSVYLPPGKVIQLEVRLAIEPIELEAITVVVRSQRLTNVGFYERRQTGLGAYISREDIEEREPLALSDMLRAIPGVRLRYDGFGRAYELLRRGCPIQYFVDGAMVASGTGFYLDLMMPGDIEGIEIYRGAATIPPEFNRGTPTCGVIVVWTRSSD
ncbi:MAG: TonB-dependent receptor plug domain-containing protein [Gemmatimonadetes bacterium]|nr:TonB-dependent receptor plug domain-containing protein [Gemmatimonadota bacterium]